MPVSRSREALASSFPVNRCFGGRTQAGKDHAENKELKRMTIRRKVVTP
jgi:hypothetical protein